MTKILGEYLLKNSFLVSVSDPALTLSVGTRPNPTPHKPRNFLLRTSPNGRAVYLSSLFRLPNGPNSSREAYSLDYAGEYLTMLVDRATGIVLIRRREPGEYAPLPGPNPGQTGGKNAGIRPKHRRNIGKSRQLRERQ